MFTLISTCILLIRVRRGSGHLLSLIQLILYIRQLRCCICGGAMRWRYRNPRDRKRPDRERPEICYAHARPFPAFFSYYGSSTNTMAARSDRMSRDPFGIPLGVRMCNRKLSNIHPSGAFWPEVTSPWQKVIRRGWMGCAYAWSEVPLGCSLRCPRPIFSMIIGTSTRVLCLT